MAHRPVRMPDGLTRNQIDRLTELSTRASAKTPADLRADIQRHLENAANAAVRNRMVNVRLARALAETLDHVLEKWDSLPADARRWLGGACLYFTECDDDEPDLSSPIGFEDDAEILNACLRFAKMNELCLRVEDYDGV